MARRTDTNGSGHTTYGSVWDDCSSMKTANDRREEQLRTLLVSKLKKSVSDFEKYKHTYSSGMEDSMQCLALISKYHGEIKVLTDIVAESNLLLGYDGDGTNNLSYYQKIEEEARNKRNKIIERNRNQSIRNKPYGLEGAKSTIEQTRQISNEETVTISSNELNELVGTLKSAINLIQDNAEDIAKYKAYQRKSKEIEKEKNPNFNKNVDTDKLYEEYKANGFRLKKDMCERYKKEYGITMHGLRNRLIKAGKWKGRILKDKE